MGDEAGIISPPPSLSSPQFRSQVWFTENKISFDYVKMHYFPPLVVHKSLTTLVIDVQAILVMPCCGFSGQSLTVMKVGHRMESTL